jgi:L-threonylcarbamoyladenylate synthase
MPRVLSATSADSLAQSVREAATALREGRLVAFPTETVYGLGGLALDATAVARIFAAKGRPATHPLIVHVADVAAARALASSWSDEAEALAEAFWPGPLTLIVPRAAHVPASVGGGGDTVGVRIPAHPVALALLRAVAAPVAAPSANRYQTVSPTTAAHVVKSLGARVDLVLDGGPCARGIESTVVDVTASPPVLLRLGATDAERVRRVTGRLEVHTAPAPDGPVHRAPGLDLRHYAPNAAVALVDDRAALAALARESEGGRTGVLLVGEPMALPDVVDVVVLPQDAEGYARGLFAALHTLEDAGCTRILVEAVPEDDAWAAVVDRLARASA